MRPPDTSHDIDKPKAPPWAVARGARIWLGGHDQPTKTILESRLPPTCRPPTGPLDAALIVPRSIDEAIYFADKVAKRLVPGGSLWVIAPHDPSAADSRTTDMIVAHAKTLAAAGWRVVERMEADRNLIATRLERAADPPESLDRP